MRRLGEILRTQYIGAIAIGFLLAQAAGNFVSTLVQPLITYYENRSRPQSVFASASIFNWPSIIVTLTNMLLYLIAALLLVAWLYRKQKVEPPAAGKTEQSQAKS